MKILKTKLLLLLLITFTNLVNAQITVTGKVTDDTNIAIEYANVVLLDSAAKIINGTITDEKGNFILETSKKDSYKLQISYIGFTDYTKTITASVDLGTIALKAGNTLDEIVLTSRKKIVERKVDRLVFNVQNAPFLKASDGVEILKRTPRINTNSDAIAILGKDKVKVMINDRMTTLSGGELSAYLQTLTAKDILKIEVITNPSAKYAAAGNTGIINIVLAKKQADYYSGNIRAIYKPATYNAGEVMGSYNFKKGKWLLSSSINRAKGFREDLQNSTIEYPNQKWVYTNVGKRQFNNISGRLTLDYTISKNTLVGLQYSGGLFKYPINANSKTIMYNNANTIDSLLINKTNSKSKNQTHAINTHFQTKLDSLDRKLTVDIDYFTFQKNTNELFESTSPNNFVNNNNFGINNLNSLSAKVDLELPYDFADLETGLKVSMTTNDSDIKNYNIIVGTPVLNVSQSNVFEYAEQNQAIYLSASKELNEKWELEAGIRLEATQTNGYSKTLNQTTTNRYTKLFPTFYLGYEPNDNNSFSIDYGRRIKRPYYFQLNPFRSNSDMFTYVEGNPLLKPSFIDNVELSHSYKDLLETAIYYKQVANGFNQITILHPNNVQQIIPKNYFNSEEFGLTETVSFNITKKWEISNDIYVYYLKATSIIPEVKAKNEGLTAYLETDNSFILNTKKTFFATLDYWYQFPEASDLDNANAYSELNIGFKALLLDKKLIISLKGTDVLKTHRETYISYNSANVKTTFSNYYDNRRLILAATYRFGNTKIKGSYHKGSNKEEKSRTK